jgi:hypothetical protein
VLGWVKKKKIFEGWVAKKFGQENVYHISALLANHVHHIICHLQ